MFKILSLRHLHLLWLLSIMPCYAATMPAPGQVSVDNNNPVGFPNSATAITLTLQEAILLALRNNPDVKNAELQRVTDKFSLAIARNQFLPQYTLTGQSIYQSGSKPLYSGNQAISLLLPFGATIGTGLTQTYNSGADRRVLNNASLSIMQPLLRGFGFAVTEAGLANATDTEKSNKLSFKGQIINTVVAVVNSYYALVESYNNLQTNALSLKDAQKTLQQTLVKIKAGKAAPADQIQQQAVIANIELNVAQAKNTIRQNYQSLLIVLGLDPTAKLNIVKHITAVKDSPPGLDESIQIALKKNVAYQQTLLSYRIIERGITTAKDAQKWQLNATGAINQALQQNFGAPTMNKSLTLDLAVPIHDLSRQQQLVNAKILLEQTKNNLQQTKNQLIAAVTDAYENLKFNQRQLVLYQNSIKLAQQSLDTAKIKFNYGKISAFELTSLQTALTTTQLGYISQQIAYLDSIESFYQTLGTTLDRWHIVLSY